MKKPLLLFLLSLLVLELVLQVWSFFHSGHPSFDSFLQKACSEIQKSGENDIFFVGDSTVYGLGCSGETTQFSLPAQLEKLMKTAKPDAKIINLGYSGTCTEQHLDIMELLPDNATVFYRGGISDDWNDDRKKIRLRIMGRIFEIKILRMLQIFFKAFYPTLTFNPEKRNQKIHLRLNNLLENRNMKIISVDYTSYPQKRNRARFSSFFYLPEGQTKILNIPLRRLLTTQGYMEGEKLKPQFISMTGTHPNDLGYFLEARALFNFLCQQQMLDFRPENQLTENSVTDMVTSLKKDYEAAKKRLRQTGIDDFSTQNRRLKLQNTLFQVWSLSQTLNGMEPQNLKIREEHLKIEKIGALNLHDSRIIMIHLKGMPLSVSEDRNSTAPSIRQDILYDTIRQLNIIAALETAQRENDNIFDELPLKKDFMKFSYTPYISGFPLFPLELCERFIQKTAHTREELSAEAEWNYFFSIPYSYFRENIPEQCHI